MPLELVIIPCLTDNFAYLVHDPATGRTACIDAPEAGPIVAELSRRGWDLSELFLTHHHGDHVDGAAGLRVAYPDLTIAGAQADAHRLPPIDIALVPGQAVTICGEPAEVIDVPGHTIGHVAFYLPESGLAFTGDSLMAMGCGRLFEGSADQMWGALSRLAALPDATRILSGHDYLAANARFAASVEPGNDAAAARAERHRSEGGTDALHVTLAEEKATNPFLRAGEPHMKAGLGMSDAADAGVFAALRARKDRF